MESVKKSHLEPFLWEDNFSEEQYDLLVSCAQSGSMKEWLLYRRRNRQQKILLEGAVLDDLNLSKADLRGAKLHNSSFCRAILEKTMFMKSEIQGARFDGAKLDGADFLASNLRSTRFTSVTGKGISFRFADLQLSDFHEAECLDSNFDRANLSKATFHGANLTSSLFDHCDMKAAIFTEVKLQGTRFHAAIVDGQTLVWDCEFDEQTNFAGVGLSNARIEPQLVSRFQTNIRRNWWRAKIKNKRVELGSFHSCFKETPFLGIPKKGMNWIKETIVNDFIEVFWKITDYGASTARLLKSVMLVSLVFALLYAFIPGATSENFSAFSPVVRLLRAFYFSIVTTTTVGFGDISANSSSITSHFILIAHLLTGYTLLGALIVRLGILFQNLPDAEIAKKGTKDE